MFQHIPSHKQTNKHEHLKGMPFSHIKLAQFMVNNNYNWLTKYEVKELSYLILSFL